VIPDGSRLIAPEMLVEIEADAISFAKTGRDVP